MAARNVVFSLDSNFTLYNFPAAVNLSNYTLRSIAKLEMHMHLENGLFFYVSSAIMLHILVGPSNKLSDRVQREKQTRSHFVNPKGKYNALFLPFFNATCL